MVPFALLAMLLLALPATVADMTHGEMSPIIRRPNPTGLFRLGSGAVGTQPRTSSTKIAPRSGNFVPETSRSMVQGNQALCLILLAAITSTICFMMPHGPGGGVPGMITGSRDFNYRIPPPWSPEHEQQYSFRAYMTDLSLWIMLTDLLPHQQCAAIVMRLGGAAREMARCITPQEMIHGGVRNGQQLDPVTYLIGALHAKFAALEEESRLQCMTEMLAFTRRPNETINAVLARYETVRQRAATEGQFIMSFEGCSLQLLRTCNIQASQLFILLQPFGGQLPQDEAQFQQLCTQLRRYGHISERSPGNVAALIQGNYGQARPGAYFSDDQRQAYHTAVQNSSNGANIAAFMAHAAPTYMSDLGGSTQWDSLQPQQPPYPAYGDNNPFATWQGSDPHSQQWYPSSGGGQSAEPFAGPQYHVDQSMPQYMADVDMSSSSSSATSSDDGQTSVDMPDLSNMSDENAAQHMYLIYRRHKRMWRRFTGRPVRKFRRTFKRHLKHTYPQRFRPFGRSHGHKGAKGGGKRSGPRQRMFWTADEALVFLKGKGKGGKSHSSGKGHGRRRNPRGKDGETMKCHKCGSEEHLQRECPQNGGGGAPSPPVMLASGQSTGNEMWTGLAGPSHGGGQSAEAMCAPSFSSPSAPWSDDDLVNETYTSTYMTDPFQIQDPWNNNRPPSPPRPAVPRTDMGLLSGPLTLTGQQLQSRATSSTDPNPFGGNGMNPFTNIFVPPRSTSGNTRVEPSLAEAARVPVDPQVGEDDELSESHSREATPRINITPNNFDASAASAPLERRTGNYISDGALATLLSCQTLTESHRDEFTDPRPAMLRHPYPLNSTMSVTARLSNFNRPKAPPGAPSSMALLTQAINVTSHLRRGPPPVIPPASDDRVLTALTTPREASRPNSVVTPGEASRPNSVVPPEQGSVSRPESTRLQTSEPAASPRSQHTDPDLTGAAGNNPQTQNGEREPLLTHDEHAQDDPVPIFYEGNDDSCSICTEQFTHGERVCRLACRHVFHSGCWDLYRSQSTDSTYCCPNCRGGPTIIACWHYIDSSRVTQQVGSQSAENLLERNSTDEGHAVHYNMSSPPSSIQPDSDTELVCPSFDCLHIKTKLPDGRIAVIIDPGSVWDLIVETNGQNLWPSPLASLA